jgi:CheY-like chemotaxis protein
MWELQTRAALSPAAGLAIMRENVPQVVFLDISMPGLTGFEVLAFLRREPALAEVPVIIVTSDDQPETKVRALQKGAQGLIVKPVMPEVLETTLQQLGILHN